MYSINDMSDPCNTVTDNIRITYIHIYAVTGHRSLTPSFFVKAFHTQEKCKTFDGY